MVESTPTISSFGEQEVGISLYLADIESADHKPVTISCTFKHRYSDFIVNEINEAGEVVWFKAETDLQKWKKANIQQTLPEEPEALEEEVKESKSDGITPYPEVLAKL